jgi:sugar phosphate isomerase/epimerase
MERIPALLGERLDRIGLAFITLGADAARDFEGTLRQVASIGYRELDMYIYASGLEAPATRAILDRVGLTCPSARVTTVSLYRGWERFLDAAVALGSRYITLANVPPDERRAVRDWHELAELFNRVGESAARAGLTFCYHNHAFEFEPLEGRVPFELLLSETDLRLVKLQVDVYWITRGGRDPAAELRRLAGRVASVHLKDMDATAARGITTVGRGTIRFANVIRAAADTGVRHFFVEEDAPPPPAIDAVRASYEFLRKLDF